MYPIIILSNLLSLRKFPKINKEDLQDEIQKTASEIVEAEQRFRLLQGEVINIIIGFVLILAPYAILQFILKECHADFLSVVDANVLLLTQKGIDIFFSIVGGFTFLFMGIIYMRVWAYAFSQSEKRIYLSQLQNQL